MKTNSIIIADRHRYIEEHNIFGMWRLIATTTTTTTKKKEILKDIFVLVVCMYLLFLRAAF